MQACAWHVWERARKAVWGDGQGETGDELKYPLAEFLLSLYVSPFSFHFFLNYTC